MRNMLRPTLVGALAVGIAACADDPRLGTDPLRPSFAARGRAPSVFVVDVSRDTTAQNETPVAANPTNPDNLLTAANDWNYNDGVAYNVSFDGGRTWSATLPDGFIPGLTRYTNDPDPNVHGTACYDAAGSPADLLTCWCKSRGCSSMASARTHPCRTPTPGTARGHSRPRSRSPKARSGTTRMPAS